MPTETRAARVHEWGTPLRFEKTLLPEVGAGEVLIGIRACGVCRSDVNTWVGNNRVQLPHTLGHEAVGVVVEAGPEVSHVAQGDRVCLHTFISCGKCFYCLRGLEQCCETWTMLGFTSGAPGTFADHVVLPASNVNRLPASIPFEQGTVITSPLATAYSGVCKAGIVPGDTILVLGAGAIGFHVALAAKAAGGARIYCADISTARLKRLERLGITGIDVNQDDPVKAIRDVTHGRGSDATFEAVGVESTIKSAFVATRRGGRIVFLGGSYVPIRLNFEDYRNEFAFRELRIATSVGNQAHEISRIVELVSCGQIDLSESVTEILPFEDATRALERARDSVNDPIRIVLTWG